MFNDTQNLLTLNSDAKAGGVFLVMRGRRLRGRVILHLKRFLSRNRVPRLCVVPCDIAHYDTADKILLNDEFTKLPW